MNNAIRCLLACVAPAMLSANALDAAPFIVEDGQPNAEIVVAEDPPRMASLAARELRDYLAKITGAELPIVTEPSDAHPVAIYVGRSAFADELGVTDEGLRYGAYRMVSGPDWLALVGRDFDFEPREPWARSHSDQERAQEAWEEAAGGHWRNPLGSLHRDYHREAGVWMHDEGGSLNAVYGWLRSLGARWYMAGELGEVLPRLRSVPLPEVDETAEPDFAIRYACYWYNYGTAAMDELLWNRRLGLNSPNERQGVGMWAHGLRNVHGHPEMQRNHPEYYALVAGQRDTEFRGTGHACFSSEGLFRETVNYARAVFDILDEPSATISPQDGYRACDCPLCRGKTPSELVWGFTDRVARELYKTHPDRLVFSAAYTNYRNPPETIEKFSPNVAVTISHHRPGLSDPETWERYWSLVEEWRAKVAPGNLVRNANNRAHLIHPRAVARDLRALKGVSLGERSEVHRGSEQRITNPGHNHLTIYVNARFLWDADQDLDELLEEYYTLFYGPAREEMKQALEFAERNQVRSPNRSQTPGQYYQSHEDSLRFVEMLLAARERAGDTVYGQRVQVILDELPAPEELREKLDELAEIGDPRADAPVAVGQVVGPDTEWADYPLVYLRGGEAPDLKTTFRVGWDRDAIYFDVHCSEPDMENLAVAENVWSGDSVAILIETQYHSYYHIEINPDGTVYDSSEGPGGEKTRWSSLAEVKTHRGEDYWRIEARMPVGAPGVDGAETDPMNRLVGDRPTVDSPWFFLLGRVRVRGQERTGYGFTPTGGGFHVPLKFGRLYIEE